LDYGYQDRVFVGPNLEFTVVPEPSFISVAAIGAIAMLMVRWSGVGKRRTP
jgi:hypothetical protein